MTYEQFWDADPYLVRHYRKAYKTRAEMRNQEMWLQGLYFFNAVSVAISNMNMGGGKPNRNKYMEKPIDIFPPTEEELERRAEETRQRMIASLSALKSSWDSQHKEHKNGD